jgi:hypothetical protein
MILFKNSDGSLPGVLYGKKFISAAKKYNGYECYK